MKPTTQPRKAKATRKPEANGRLVKLALKAGQWDRAAEVTHRRAA
jgi:hypothetical protein